MRTWRSQRAAIERSCVTITSVVPCSRLSSNISSITFSPVAKSRLPVGFVFQSFQLMANLTALENVMLPLELQGRADAKVEALGMLERVGLGERLGHYPKLLSGGEQQRVALARAFVVRPALLLADEPTGSLDFATGEKVIELMFELNREQGTTLVMVTHDRSIAARCDRQVRIEAGRLVA